MRPKRFLIDPVPVDADGIAEIQTVLGAADLVLDGALVVGGVFIGDYARQIAIISSGDDSGITFLVTGTNAEGNAQTESITGGAVATVESTKYFKTITSILSSGAAAANVTVGTVDEFVMPIVPLNHYSDEGAMVSFENIVGTLSISAVITFSNLQNGDTIDFHAGPAGLTDETADVYGTISPQATGVRLVMGSYTSGAQLTAVIMQERG